MRLVTHPNISDGLRDIEEHWSIDDVHDAHTLLDLQSAVDAKQALAMKGKR